MQGYILTMVIFFLFILLYSHSTIRESVCKKDKITIKSTNLQFASFFWLSDKSHDFDATTHPSEEFKLTANSLQAHMKPHGKLILKSLNYLTAHS